MRKLSKKSALSLSQHASSQKRLPAGQKSVLRKPLKGNQSIQWNLWNDMILLVLVIMLMLYCYVIKYFCCCWCFKCCCTLSWQSVMLQQGSGDAGVLWDKVRWVAEAEAWAECANEGIRTQFFPQENILPFQSKFFAKFVEAEDITWKHFLAFMDLWCTDTVVMYKHCHWKKGFEKVLVVLIKSGGFSMRRRVSSLSSCNCTDLRLLNLTERFRKMGSCEQLLVAQIKGRKWPELNALIFKGTLEKSPVQPVARWV